MIKELDGLPPGVIGFETAGKLSAEDYRDVVLPALERAAASGEVRFVVVIPEFHGMSGGALWQDLKVGVEHLRAWKRIAVVTDIEWVDHMITLFGWMTPGEVRHFPLARSHFQSWSEQVSTPSSIFPVLVRSARRCGHLRCTIQSPSWASSVWSVCSAYQFSTYSMRSRERHLRNVVRNSLNLPLRPTSNCIDRKIEFDQSIS